VVATIVDDAAPDAREAAAAMARAGLRVETDLRNEKIDRKVKDHILARVPVLAVIGRREAEQGAVVLRRLPGREQEALPLADAVARLAAEGTPPDLAPTKAAVAAA
jgi:threonyl-tRNA synthetase